MVSNSVPRRSFPARSRHVPDAIEEPHSVAVPDAFAVATAAPQKLQFLNACTTRRRVILPENPPNCFEPLSWLHSA
jgi:hypothetical protein